MQKIKFLTLLISSCGLIFAIASCTKSQSSSQGDIIVCSKNFTEQLILGELLAQHMETTTNLTVTRKLGLAGSLCHQSIVAGKVDTYIEYTGTAFTAILQQKPISNAQEVYRQVKQQYAQKFNLEVTNPLGFENTFAMIVRGEDAQKLNIKTLSQAAKYTQNWQAGVGYEFIERQDGFPGLVKTYGFQFAKPPQPMNLGLMYRALVDKKVDLIAGNSTDGLIEKLNLVILKDDKKYFPPYEATPIVRQETLKKYPALRQAFDRLQGSISQKEMQRLNYQVVGEFRKVEDVAREFLQSKHSQLNRSAHPH